MLHAVQPSRFVGPAALFAVALLLMGGLPRSVERMAPPAGIERQPLLIARAGPVQVVPAAQQEGPASSDGAAVPSATGVVDEIEGGHETTDRAEADKGPAAAEPEAEPSSSAKTPAGVIVSAVGGMQGAAAVRPVPAGPPVGVRPATEAGGPGAASGGALGDACAGRVVGGFRDPLPAVPVWNPAGPKRVGLQAGHWQVERAPAELGGLQHGAVGGGKQEWEVNLDIARRTAAMLEAAGVQVDLLPTTVPPRYRVHAFVSIHADGDPSGRLRGFKIARPGFSSVPQADDRLVGALIAAYGPATGLRRDDEHITPRMLYYYAFNSRRYCHAVAPGVPQAIVETGFLTNAADRALLLGNPDAAARGIAEGVLGFLGARS